VVSQTFFDLWHRRPKVADHFTLKEWAPGAILLFSLVAAIQIYRVRCSVRRTEIKEGSPALATFWNLQISVQNKVRALLLFVLGFGGLGLMFYRLGLLGIQ
jgi:hypothetical protein